MTALRDSASMMDTQGAVGDAIVVTNSLIVFASHGPFGPTTASCLLMPVLILGPFVLLAIAARSLLGADPLSGWLLGLMFLGDGGLAYLVWPAEIFGGSSSGFWGLW